MLLVLLCLCLLAAVSSHTKDDPILTLTRSRHVNAETEWKELPLDQVPQYLNEKQVVFHATVPKYDPNITTNYRININHDLKVSFLFDHIQKLSTPWITVFDSIGRKSLKKLEITFIHDEFEIVKVLYTPTYGSQLSRIDPTHPTLRGFELVYTWENVQEEDIALAIQVLFASVLVGLCVLVSMMMCSVDLDYRPTIESSTDKGKPIHRSSSGERGRGSPNIFVPPDKYKR